MKSNAIFIFKRATLIFVVFLAFGCSLQEKQLPQLGVLPEFELINQEGKKVSLKDYENKVWVANFMFTSCGGTCPMLTQRMTKVQKALKEEAKQLESLGQYPCRIVSFSVDPERDTPEKLSEYAQRFGADKKLWSFLTGPADQVTETIVKGFKTVMQKVPLESGQNPEDISTFDVVHGEKFILVDQKARIRGYYDSDALGIKQLLADMKKLAGAS